MTVLHELPILGALIAAGLFMAVMLAVSIEDAIRH